MIEAQFETVWLWDGAIEEFVLVGCYTKRGEAEAHLNQLIESGKNSHPAPIRMTLSEIKHALLKERLGKMTVALEAVEKIYHQISGAA